MLGDVGEACRRAQSEALVRGKHSCRHACRPRLSHWCEYPTEHKGIPAHSSHPDDPDLEQRDHDVSRGHDVSQERKCDMAMHDEQKRCCLHPSHPSRHLLDMAELRADRNLAACQYHGAVQ